MLDLPAGRCTMYDVDDGGYRSIELSYSRKVNQFNHLIRSQHPPI